MQFKVELFTSPSPAVPGSTMQQHPLVFTSYIPAMPQLSLIPPKEQNLALGWQMLTGR